MTTETIQKLDMKIKALDASIADIRQKANTRIKPLKEKREKLVSKKSALIVKMTEGIPSEKLISAIESLKTENLKNS